MKILFVLLFLVSCASHEFTPIKNDDTDYNKEAYSRLR